MKTKLLVATVLLVLAILVERFCFLVAVYKTKYYGYVVILIVIFFNSIFNYFNARLRNTKHKRRLHEMFNIERTPKIGYCVIAFIGCLDMFYAFFLFWPANVIPMWHLIILLQLFIPLNMFLRSCCVGLKHYKIHVYASLVILIGVSVSLLDITGYN